MKFVIFDELKNYGLHYSRTHIRRLLNASDSKYYDPTFPKPVPVGPARVAWVEDELIAWMKTRIDARSPQVAA